jgi:hypothetical protein
MKVEAPLIPKEGILELTGYEDWWFPGLVPSCGEVKILLPLLVIEVQFFEHTDRNLITIPTELSSLLMLEICSRL